MAADCFIKGIELRASTLALLVEYVPLESVPDLNHAVEAEDVGMCLK